MLLAFSAYNIPNNSVKPKYVHSFDKMKWKNCVYFHCNLNSENIKQQNILVNVIKGKKDCVQLE